MSTTIFLVGAAIIFTIFLVNLSLKASQDNQQDRLESIEGDIEKEKNELQLLHSQNSVLILRKRNTNKRLLKVRLELLITEDDMNGLLDQLSN